MHKWVLRGFEALRSFLQFLKICCIFLIMLLLLYWIQNLLNSTWEWMGFIAPFFDFLLKTADNIYSLSRADVMISDFSGVILDYAFLFGAAGAQGSKKRAVCRAGVCGNNLT